MLTLKAPAKINWFLRVFGLRNDGFHEIHSLFQKITLYDILTFTPATDLIVTTNSSIPMEQNLVYRAALLIKDKYKVRDGVSIQLNKHIPVSAGLGGGSSDAAAALKGLNELWSLGLSSTDLHMLAEQLGSDVPFFLYDSLAFIEGRGEKVTTLKTHRSLNILLVKPLIRVSTAWVYRSLPEISKSAATVAEKLTKEANNIKLFIIHALETEDFSGVSNKVLNDLEGVTVRSFPVIADIKDRMLREGAKFSVMSGSGPTVFGVFGSEEEASSAKVSLSETFKDFWTAVVKTINN